MQRIALALAGALIALTLATPSHATLNACSAGKKKCVAKKAAAMLKCHSKNEKPPAGLTPAKFAACIQKAKDKFDGGADPTKGCFAKLETKFPAGCLTINDTVALEGKVDAFVGDVVCELDAGSGTCPTPTLTPTPTPTATPSPGCVPNGQLCATSSQCCSMSCMANQCQPTCTDGMQDGNETGVDCGGGTCPQCPLGQGCATNTDCVATTTCMAGSCVCAAGQANCNNNSADACEVNTASDPNNCSACGLSCPNHPNSSRTCTGGTCGFACDPGFADCDVMVANGCEINTTSDNSNCGNCGLTCPGIQTCVNSVCQ